METDDSVQCNGTDISKGAPGVTYINKYSENTSSDAKSGVENGNVTFDKVPLEQTRFFLQRHRQKIIFARNCVLLLLFLAYYSYAMYCSFGDEASIRLTVFTGFGLAYIGWNTSLRFDSFRMARKAIFSVVSLMYKNDRRRKFIRWFLYFVWTGLLVAYLIINVALKDAGKLRSLGGFVVFMLLLVLLSNNRRQINWHSVFWGTALQCIIGYVVLKSSIGQTVIQWFSDRLEEFMNYSRTGSEFAFGKLYMDHPFAMQAMPSVMVFCAVIQVLIYLGTVQFIVRTLGKAVAAILDVSAPEAMNACANIFLGGIEAALLVIEYINGMPTSRLFTLMTNWFASCGGSALIQFISFGVPASYLLAASAMSAPAALVCAKLAYPDDEQKQLTDVTEEVTLEVVTNENKHYDIAKEKGDIGGKSGDAETNPDDTKEINKPGRRGKPGQDEPKSIGEALVLGTQQGLRLVTNIIANMIVSLSVLELCDKTVEWFGDRVNIHISLKIILSYVFYPFVYIMGVDEADCLRAGEMLGVRTITSAGLSYIELGKLIHNRKQLLTYSETFNETLTYTKDSDIFLPQWNQTLVGGVFSERSEIIVAYALCGFASVPMIGMLLGALTVLIPDRSAEVTRLAFKTLITGTIASYLTACIAGLVA